MPTITELRQQRAKLVADARLLQKRAETEKRDMNAEEREQFDKIMDVSLIELDGKIKDAERTQRLEAEERHLQEHAPRQAAPNPIEGRQTATQPTEYRYRPAGTRIDRVIHLSGNRSTEAYNQAFRRALTGGTGVLSAEEHRALAADNDTTGGYLVAPQQFIARIIEAVDNETFVRRLATVLPPLTSSESLGAPTRTDDVADADWTSEIATGGEDSSLKFGKRELKPAPIAKLIKVSKKLIRAASLDVEGYVRSRLAYKLGISHEKAFLTGTGANQPLGLFTASTSGISTGRDISTDNTTTAITALGLFEAKYALKAQYQKNAQWLFHRDAVKMIAKLKDSDGQFLWRASIQEGQPDMLLGRPVNMSEYVPNTFTTSLYVGMFADFSHYWIVDSLGMTVQILLELYAATNQNGYILRAETDGAPTLEEAFARVKLA